MKFNVLHVKQLDSKLKSWIGARKSPVPSRGWVNMIRVGLGLSSHQLAKRMGVSQARVMQVESAEQRGATTLNTLQNAAEAMGCQLVYGIVPKTTVRDILKNQARRVAKQQLDAVSHSMLLEAQAIDPKCQEKQLKALVDELLSGPTKQLWNRDSDV